MALRKGDTLDGENSTSSPFNEPVLLHLKEIYDRLSTPEASSGNGNAKVTNDNVFRSSAFASIQGVDDGSSTAAHEIKTFPDILSYMDSPDASAMAPMGEQDLSLPLPSYFVNSSHNTYLTGNQLYGHASTLAYEDVLLRGCRCLEIDVWDGEASSATSSSSSSLADTSSTDDPSRKSTSSSTKQKRTYVKGTASKAFHKIGRVGSKMKKIVVTDVPPDGITEEDDEGVNGRVSPPADKKKQKKKEKHRTSAFSRLNPLHSWTSIENESHAHSAAAVATKASSDTTTRKVESTTSTATSETKTKVASNTTSSAPSPAVVPTPCQPNENLKSSSVEPTSAKPTPVPIVPTISSTPPPSGPSGNTAIAQPDTTSTAHVNDNDIGTSTASQPAAGPAPNTVPDASKSAPQPRATGAVSEGNAEPTANVQRPASNGIESRTLAGEATTPRENRPLPLEVEPIEPVVLHGHTLTSSVTFRSVCETIRRTAFIASTLPLVVSLEVHACHQQQQVMVDIMKEVWGDSLLADAPEDIRAMMKGEMGENATRDIIPSPDQLRGKILVKVKPGVPKEVMEEVAEEGKGLNGNVDVFVTNDPENGTVMRKVDSEGQELAPSRSVDTETAKNLRKAAKILPALGDLGVYTAGYSFKGLATPEAAFPHHMFSLSEAMVKEAHKSHRKELFQHNRNYMMRSYPSGMRIRSSNPDPAFCWRQGIQFAALNWQKKDKGMMLNIGMFAGSEGYVLKPEEYRGDEWFRRVASGQCKDATKSPDTPTNLYTPISRRHTVTLAIEVFAGQNLPYPPNDSPNSTFNPYAVFKLNAAYADESPKALSDNTENGPADLAKITLKTPSSEGINPDFEGVKLAFPTCHNVLQELSFLRVKLYDHDYLQDDLSSWSCIRLDRLRPGYRFIRLYGTQGKSIPSSLFVRIHKHVSV